MLNLSHYPSASQPKVPVSVNSSSQEVKRYLKDYSDSDKTHDPSLAITQVKDSSGYILVIADQIKDRLVLEDPSETRLQQLARKYVLGLASQPERASLYKQIFAEFEQAEAQAAVDAAFAEKRALYSPETRKWSDGMIECIKLRKGLDNKIDTINRQWAVVSYTGPDGTRCLNEELTVLEVIKYSRLGLSDYLEKNHPTALTRMKITLVVLPFFFALAASLILGVFPL